MPEQVPLGADFRFRQVREQTERLCASLSAEDCNLQAIPETSPLKWHLAHTTWFFETFILKPFSPGYQVFNKDFQVLFNSYYNGIGKQHPRPQRHLISRPGLEEVMDYRHTVNQAISLLLEDGQPESDGEIDRRLELGLNHEQQHQELILTDLKYNLFCNPTGPAYRTTDLPAAAAADDSSSQFEALTGGLVEIGQMDGADFGFDNERPRHKVWLEPFALARGLVTNGDFLRFIADRGYQRPELWLADGWNQVQEAGWRHPLYWDLEPEHPRVFTLHGWRPLVESHPVCHLSYYEADAFARWRGARLPTEAEWEYACRETRADLQNATSTGSRKLQPVSDHSDGQLRDLFGQVWQWTASAYLPYPRYRASRDALGEYNGKFMCNQMVLRGSSCVTPHRHSRPTYRNFFYPPDRWQFTGLRLARSLDG